MFRAFVLAAVPTSAHLSSCPGTAAPVRLPDPRLRRLVWNVLWLGTTLVLLLPAARSYSPWLGWLPLWLVAMPASALWALHRFRLPWLPLAPLSARRLRRRRRGQARRRCLRAGANRASHAA